MKFKIKAQISLDSKLEPEKLKDILEPENETEDNTIIKSKIEHGLVITEIEGILTIGSLLRSIDDILATTSLAEDVADVTD